jgi:hypothetical protein
VHLPSLTVPADETLQTIAAKSTFDFSETSTMLRCGIRWFAPKLEQPPCVYAVFRSARGGTGGPTAVRFEATSHKFLVERKVEEDRIEIEIDSETLEALSTEEDVKLRAVLAKALGVYVPVRHTGRQAVHLVSMGALIEVDTLDLKTLKVNTDWLVSVHPAMSTSRLIVELNAVLWRALSRALWSSRRPLSQVSHSNLGCLDPTLV